MWGTVRLFFTVAAPNLQPHQQCIKIPMSPHPCQHLLYVFIIIIIIICLLLCHRIPRLHPWGGKVPWNREWQATPLFLPGKFHGPRSLQAIVWGLQSWTRLRDWHTHWVWSGVSLWFLLCVSPVTHVEHLFTCLLAIRMSSVEKCLFKSLVHVFSCFSYLSLYSYKNSPYILDMSLLSDNWYISDNR